MSKKAVKPVVIVSEITHHLSAKKARKLLESWQAAKDLLAQAKTVEKQCKADAIEYLKISDAGQYKVANTALYVTKSADSNPETLDADLIRADYDAMNKIVPVKTGHASGSISLKIAK